MTFFRVVKPPDGANLIAIAETITVKMVTPNANNICSKLGGSVSESCGWFMYKIGGKFHQKM